VHELNCLKCKIVIGVLSVTLENGEWTYVSVVCIIIYVFFLDKGDDKLNNYIQIFIKKSDLGQKKVAL
jgi:hypothetical protein